MFGKNSSAVTFSFNHVLLLLRLSDESFFSIMYHYLLMLYAFTFW